MARTVLETYPIYTNTPTPELLDAAAAAGVQAAAAAASVSDDLNARINQVGPSLSTGPTLTLASGNPTPAADIAGATTVYVTASPADLVGIYNGAAWVGRPISELPITLNSLYGASTIYDVWVTFDTVANAAVVGTAPWAGPTSRGAGAGTTDLEQFQGRLVNKNDITLRNGATTFTVPARQALLVGSFRTTAAGMTEDSQARRLVSNVFNLSEKEMFRRDTTYSWTYSAAAFVQANGGNGNNRVEYLHCLGGRRIDVEVISHASTSTTTAAAVMVGIGIDTAGNDSSLIRGYATLTAPGVPMPTFARYIGCPGLGYHAINWLEFGAGVAGTVQTWLGSTGYAQSGLVARTLN